MGKPARRHRQGGGKIAALPEKPPEPLGFFWTAIVAILCLSSLGMVVGAALPAWRETPAVTYRYENMSDKMTTAAYGPTQFGLILYSFNNGASSRPLSSIASLICQGAEVEAAGQEITGIIWSDGCSPSCINHWRTRCSVYTRFGDAGYVALSTVVAGGLLALGSAVWLVLGGTKRLGVVAVILTLSLLITWVGLLYWLIETNMQITKLSADSQYPSAPLGWSAYMSGLCACVNTLMAIMIGMGYAIKDSFAWRARKEEINDTLLSDVSGTTPSNLGAFNGGGGRLPPGMSPFAGGGGGYNSPDGGPFRGGFMMLAGSAPRQIPPMRPPMLAPDAGAMGRPPPRLGPPGVQPPMPQFNRRS